MTCPIQSVRYEVGDLDKAMPILDDEVIEYYLSKHNGSVSRASMDAAKTILFQLSSIGGETVGIFALKSGVQDYIAALKLYIKDPALNGAMSNIRASISGATNPIVSPTQSPTSNGFCGCPTGY